MFQFIIQWLISTITFMIVVNAAPGFYLNQGPWPALLAAAIIGVVNAGMGTALRFITAPVVLIIFCLFILFFNVVLTMMSSRFIPGFYVDGTDSALWVGVALCAIAVVFRIAGKAERA